MFDHSINGRESRPVGFLRLHPAASDRYHQLKYLNEHSILIQSAPQSRVRLGTCCTPLPPISYDSDCNYIMVGRVLFEFHRVVQLATVKSMILLIIGGKRDRSDQLQSLETCKHRECDYVIPLPYRKRAAVLLNRYA